jgi:hypothetical protein
MMKLIRSALVLVIFSALPTGLVLSTGCATSGGAAASDGAPVELDGSKWKLVALGSRLDGRVVEFKKRGADGYIGELAEPGSRLREATGIKIGQEIFRLRKRGLNEYEGMYRAIGPDGSFTEKEVTVFVQGNSLSWNQESAVWERVQ